MKCNKCGEDMVEVVKNKIYICRSGCKEVFK